LNDIPDYYLLSVIIKTAQAQTQAG